MIVSERPNRKSRSPLFKMALGLAILLSLMMLLPIAAAGREDGVLQREIKACGDVISVKLLGVTDYEITEIFNALLMKAPGVMEAKRYRFHLDPRKPSICVVEWQVTIGDTDVFRLESDLYNMLQNNVLNEDDVHQPAFLLRPVAENPEGLKAIRPWRSSSREIRFLSDQRLHQRPNWRHGKRPIHLDTGFE